MSKHKRWTYYEDEDGCVELETQEVELNGEVETHMFVHTYLYTDKITPAFIRKSKKIFKEVKAYSEAQGYEHLQTYTPNRRWSALMDDSFKILGSFEMQGMELEVLQW